MQETTTSHPTNEELARTIVLYYFGQALKRAEGDTDLTLRGRLTGVRAAHDSFFMKERELRVLDSLGGDPHAYKRNIADVAGQLQAVIDKTLTESGDAELLAKNGIRIHVTAGEVEGYSGTLWARFAPGPAK